MTFDEWLVREHGLNHGWTFAEVDAVRDAWNASAMIEREACAKKAEALDCRGPIYGAHPDYLEGKRMAASQIAAAIRAR